MTHTAFSFGTGIHWRQIWLDLAAEFNSEKQTESGTASWGDIPNRKEAQRTCDDLQFHRILLDRSSISDKRQILGEAG